MERWLYRFLLPLFAPDDGGGNGGGEQNDGNGGASDGGSSGSLLNKAERNDDAGSDDDSSQQQQQQDQRQQQQSDDDGEKPPTKLVFKERPDWLKPNFWNKDTGEVDVEGLQKSQDDLRKKISKGLDKVPAKPEDYKFECPEHLTAIKDLAFPEGDEDPMVNAFKAACHENGINQATAQTLYEWYVGQVQDLIPQLPDPDVEMKKLGNAGQGMVNSIAALRDTMVRSGTLNEAEAAAMDSWMTSAVAVSAFSKIQQWYGEKPIPYTAQPSSGAKSADELRGEMRKLMDKANAGDASAGREYERLMAEYEKTYGTEPAGSSTVGL